MLKDFGPYGITLRLCVFTTLSFPSFLTGEFLVIHKGMLLFFAGLTMNC